MNAVILANSFIFYSMTYLHYDDLMTMQDALSYSLLIPEYHKGFSECSPLLNKLTNPGHTH